MMYLKWAALGPLSLFMAVLGRILAPVLPFFVEEDGYLPGCLWWFQTPDNPADGDRAHRERHPGSGAWATYKRRVAWFWRNVAYGFDIEVLGLSCRYGDELTVTGDTETTTNPVHSGYVWRVLKRNGKPIGFQLYFVYRWLPGRCLRGNLGWKLWDFEGEAVSCQWTGMVNPLFGCSE